MKIENCKIVNSRGGFTLIELLMVIAIAAVLATVSFLSLSGSRASNDLQRTGEEVAAALRNTRQRSLSQENGTRWGMHFSNATSGEIYTSFGGASYASSTSQNAYTLTNGISFGNPPTSTSIDVLFNPITGYPNQNQIVSLVDGRKDGLVYDVAVNSLGSVEGKFWQGLVGYWPFDEGTGTTAYDASGNGNSGTLTNSPLWQTGSNCEAGSCLSFNTSAWKYVTTPFNASINTNLTLSAWVYPTGVGGSDTFGTIIQGQFYLSYNDSAKALSCYWYGTNPPGYFTTPNNTVPLNQWSHIACVWNGSFINEYVNGAVQNTVAVTGSGTSPSAINIGAESTARQFQGQIDDVRIYNRALSAQDIQDLYNETQ